METMAQAKSAYNKTKSLTTHRAANSHLNEFANFAVINPFDTRLFLFAVAIAYCTETTRIYEFTCANSFNLIHFF